MNKPIKKQILLHLRNFIKKQDFMRFGCGELNYDEALDVHYFDKDLYRFIIGLKDRIFCKTRLVYIEESLLLTNNFKHCYVDRYDEDDFIIKKKDIGQIVLEEI